MTEQTFKLLKEIDSLMQELADLDNLGKEIKRLDDTIELSTETATDVFTCIKMRERSIRDQIDILKSKTQLAYSDGTVLPNEKGFKK